MPRTVPLAQVANADDIMRCVISSKCDWLLNNKSEAWGEVHTVLQSEISGAAGFLTTKLMINGLLHSQQKKVLRDVGVEWGPGALCSQLSGLLLLRDGKYKVSQKFKWSNVSQAERDLVLQSDIPRVAQEIAKHIKSVAVAYWKSRMRLDKELRRFDHRMMALIDRIIPTLVVEGLECEVRRRRTAALMWATFRFPYCPKVCRTGKHLP